MIVIRCKPETLQKLTFGFFDKILGVTIFPFIIVNKDSANIEGTIKHEKIHIYQQLECLLIFFPIIYYGNYLWNRFKGLTPIQAYKHIIFEQEAYTVEDSDVPRKPYGWLRLI